MAKRCLHSFVSIAISFVISSMTSFQIAHATENCDNWDASLPSSTLEHIATSAYCDGTLHGAVLVADGSRVLYQGAFGSSGLDGELNKVDDQYPIFSITKPFTAILTLQFVEEGKVALADTVAKRLPGLTVPRADQITLHHLLTHQSGLPDYITAIPGYLSESPPNLSRAEVMNRIAGMQLEFDPGEAFAYSNTGYAVLAMILEDAAGESFQDLLNSRIFGPLSMKDSFWRDYSDKMATIDLLSADGKSLAPKERMLQGEAGIVSTLFDMHRFALAIGSEKLLSKEMWELAFTPHSDPKDAFRSTPMTWFPYGYGFSVYEAPVDGSPMKILMHGGAGHGGSALLERGKNDDWIVLFWNNKDGITPYIRPLTDAAIAQSKEQ